MAKENINWGAKQQSPANTPEHPDRRINELAAATFSKNIQKSLLEGMNVSTGPSVVTISFNPPESIPMGPHANPVSLNQSRDSFSKELEQTINAIMGVAKRAHKMHQ